MASYAANDSEAKDRFDKFRSLDPFPSIDAALLNAADIDDYVRETGMIYPFDPNKIKSASYEMDLGGEVLYWDENDKIENYVPLVRTEIPLRKNSITFVTVDATFRLPDL